MAAPYGNRNAEKWTFRKAIQLFKDAIELTNKTDEFVIRVDNKMITKTGYKFDFIGEIARELGTYHEIFSHLVKRFPSLKRLRNQLNTNIEQNCYSNGKKGIIKEASALMNLKANWRWRDRVDTTSNDKEIKRDSPLVLNVDSKELKL